MGRTKLQKILSTTAILGSFVVVGALVLMMMGVIKSSRVVVDFLLIVGILCFGCISCMVVARYINDKSKRIPVLIVLISTAVTCLLWIIFIFVGQAFIDAIMGEGEITEASFRALFVFAKITAVITIQTSFANLVVSNLFRLRKDMIIFQGIMYFSNAVMDFWISALILSLRLTDGGIELAWKSLIESKFWVTLFVLATVYTGISNVILRKYEKRVVRDNAVYGKETFSDSYEQVKQEIKDTEEKKQPTTIEDRIKKLDELKEKNLITEEEYTTRKSKILEDI